MEKEIKKEKDRKVERKKETDKEGHVRKVKKKHSNIEFH
jgi:hypothetical protein